MSEAVNLIAVAKNKTEKYRNIVQDLQDKRDDLPIETRSEAWKALLEVAALELFDDQVLISELKLNASVSSYQEKQLRPLIELIRDAGYSLRLLSDLACR